MELLGRLLIEEVIESRGTYPTRADGVGLNIGTGHFVSHRTREGDDCAFARRAVRVVRSHGADAGEAGNVDHLAVARHTGNQRNSTVQLPGKTHHLTMGLSLTKPLLFDLTLRDIHLLI
ncbi:hypothetical protein FQZ97_1022150 [compost metagenome]